MVDAITSVASVLASQLKDRDNLNTVKEIILSRLKRELAESNSRTEKIKRYDEFIEFAYNHVKTNPDLYAHPLIERMLEKDHDDDEQSGGGSEWFTHRDILHNKP